MSPGLAVPAWHAAISSRAARKSWTMSGSSPPTTTGFTRSYPRSTKRTISGRATAGGFIIASYTVENLGGEDRRRHRRLGGSEERAALGARRGSAAFRRDRRRTRVGAAAGGARAGARARLRPRRDPSSGPGGRG